jgi:predicted Zn-dependent peptidase
MTVQSLRPGLALVLLLLTCLPTFSPPPAQAQAEPGLFQQVLPNGMLAVVRERPGSNLAAITVGIRGGSRVEDPVTLGAAHFMEHMYFQGTPRRPNFGDFDRDVEALGGSNNAWTDTESINFQIVVPVDGFDLGLDVMADEMVNSTFPAERLEKERRVVIEELNQTLNDPAEYLVEVFLKEVARGHPIQHLPGGDRTTVGRVTRDTILHYRDTYFVANNMVVAVVGGVQHEAIFPKLAAAFADMRQGPRPPWPAVAPPAAQARRVELDYDAAQAQIGYGFPVAGLDSDDRYPLEVASALLGTAGQRLFGALVDRDALATDVESAYFTYTDLGIWLSSAACPPERVDPVLDRLRVELRRLGDEPLSPADLAQARGYLAGRRELGLEQIVDQSVDLSDGLVTGTYQPLDDYLAHLNAVTPADVQRVARQYLNPDRALEVILRPKP